MTTQILFFLPLDGAGSIDNNQENQVYTSLCEKNFQDTCEDLQNLDKEIILKHYMWLEDLFIDMDISMASCNEILKFTELFLSYCKYIGHLCSVNLNEYENECIIDIIELNKKTKDFIKEDLDAYIMSDYFKKRLYLLMIHVNFNSKSIIDVSKNRIYSISQNLYKFIEKYSTLIAVDEYKTQRFTDIFIFTAELLIFEIASRKYIEVFLKYPIVYNINDNHKENHKEPIYIQAKLKNKISIVIDFYKNIYITKAIYFSIVLSDLIHNSRIITQKRSNNTFTGKGVDIFKQITYASSCESIKLSKYSENTIFFTLRKYLTSKKVEFNDIKNELKENKKKLENEQKLIENYVEKKGEKCIKGKENMLKEVKNKIHKKKEKFISTFMKDFIEFVRQYYLDKPSFYCENMCIYKINKFSLLFEFISSFYSVDFIFNDNQLKTNSYEDIKDLYYKVLLSLFLNDQNIVETLV